MEKLREDHGFSTVDRALRFLSIRLGSRPETAEMVKELDAVRDDLHSKDNAWKNAREQRIAATAETEFLDDLLDESVMSLSREVLVLTKNDRNSPVYKKLFPMAPSSAMDPVTADEQSVYVKGIVSRLKEDGDYEKLAHYADSIDGHFNVLSSAIKKRDELYMPESRASTDRNIALDKARRVYNLMYPRLQIALPEHPELVETFFANISRRSSAKEEPSE